MSIVIVVDGFDMNVFVIIINHVGRTRRRKLKRFRRQSDSHHHNFGKIILTIRIKYTANDFDRTVVGHDKKIRRRIIFVEGDASHEVTIFKNDLFRSLNENKSTEQNVFFKCAIFEFQHTGEGEVADGK